VHNSTNSVRLLYYLYQKVQLYAAREDEWETRDKIGYLVRRFSQLGKG